MIVAIKYAWKPEGAHIENKGEEMAARRMLLANFIALIMTATASAKQPEGFSVAAAITNIFCIEAIKSEKEINRRNAGRRAAVEEELLCCVSC